MKKLHLAAAAILVAVFMLPSAADAKNRENFTNKAGRFGIGYDGTLGGVNGLSARFQVAKNFGIQGVVSFSRVSVDPEDPDAPEAITGRTDSSVLFALRGDVGFAYTRQATLGIIFGVNLYNTAFEVDEGDDDSDTRFSFEAGLKAEYHFTDFFSVHGEVGFVFALLNNQNDVGLIAGQTGTGTDAGAAADEAKVEGTLILFGIGDPFGSFGFTFWFK